VTAPFGEFDILYLDPHLRVVKTTQACSLPYAQALTNAQASPYNYTGVRPYICAVAALICSLMFLCASHCRVTGASICVSLFMSYLSSLLLPPLSGVHTHTTLSVSFPLPLSLCLSLTHTHIQTRNVCGMCMCLVCVGRPTNAAVL
jgi:hypothetical protein